MKEKEERIREKLEEIRKNLEELERIVPDDYESYESNNEKRAACERYFERIVEAVVDAAFLVINEYELKIPDEDKGAFDIVADAGFISKELAGRLKDAKGMRNILAHEYGKVDDNLVFSAISEEISRDVNEFLDFIGKLNSKGVKMDKKRLNKIWEKYVNRKLYRVVPERDILDIKRNGINPLKNPFEKFKPLLEKFFNIILKLEKKGVVMKFGWGNKEATGGYAVKIFRYDLNRNFVDFGPTRKSVDIYLGIEGGALVNNMGRIAKRVFEVNPELAKAEWIIIKKVNNWALKRKCPNRIISISGNLKYLESGRMQLLGLDKSKVKKIIKITYLPSPFGSFERFEHIATKNGLDIYLKYFKSNMFYLRVEDKIPAEAIKIYGR